MQTPQWVSVHFGSFPVFALFLASIALVVMLVLAGALNLY